MTTLPREICPECGQPIESGVPRNGLTGEHWTCYKRRRPYPDLSMQSMLRGLRPFVRDIAWKPEPDRLEGPKANGWLSPDGKFYGCPSQAHIDLGAALAEYFGLGSNSSALERAGWGHISNVGFYIRYDYDERHSVEPTQAQLDALWDWFQTLKEGDEAYKYLGYLFRRRDAR